MSASALSAITLAALARVSGRASPVDSVIQLAPQLRLARGCFRRRRWPRFDQFDCFAFHVLHVLSFGAWLSTRPRGAFSNGDSLADFPNTTPSGDRVKFTTSGGSCGSGIPNATFVGTWPPGRACEAPRFVPAPRAPSLSNDPRSQGSSRRQGASGPSAAAVLGPIWNGGALGASGGATSGEFCRRLAAGGADSTGEGAGAALTVPVESTMKSASISIGSGAGFAGLARSAAPRSLGLPLGFPLSPLPAAQILQAVFRDLVRGASRALGPPSASGLRFFFHARVFHLSSFAPLPYYRYPVKRKGAK